VIDGVTNAVVRTIAVGSDPIALCHNPTNNTVWCANNYSRNVSVINAATNSVVATVLAGVRPNWLSHNPVNNRI